MQAIVVVAQELVARHGPGAAGIIQERIKKFENAQDWVNHRRALLVLNEVERLVLPR